MQPRSIRAKRSAFIIKSRSARTHLRKIWLHGQIFKPHPWGMWRKGSNSQFQMANHRNWGIMGYNDLIVCVTVINLTNAFFFTGLDRSRLTNRDRLDCWLWTQSISAVYHCVDVYQSVWLCHCVSVRAVVCTRVFMCTHILITLSCIRVLAGSVCVSWGWVNDTDIVL